MPSTALDAGRAASVLEQFTRRLGRAPAAYLLRTTAIPIAAVARQVGYDSEAAFSRAFRRRYDTPPLRYRKGDTPPRP
ncbi:helix-turn-helix domain-containing protein [Nocardia sp. CA-136227]|uniref:helix-turn-helix domain-containing protein n=1 Tax=Nocardia sp. CA-136227 TaxID=3239979 RepID=UPI003D95F7AC